MQKPTEKDHVLTVEDWDFSKVPDSEIQYCCLYEYCREAERKLWTIARQQEGRRLRRERKKHGPDEQARLVTPFFQRLSFNGLKKKRWHSKPFLWPPSWQSLTEPEKYYCEARINAWLEKKKKPEPLRSPLRFHQSVTIRDDVAEHGNEAEGSVSVALEVHLQKYGNGDILDAVRTWLRKTREFYGIRGTNKTGPWEEKWRKRLDNLGIMRLQHYHMIEKIRALLRGHPLKFWMDGGRNADGDQEILVKASNHREKALKFFRECFTELPAPAEPEHYTAALRRDPAADA